MCQSFRPSEVNNAQNAWEMLKSNIFASYLDLKDVMTPRWVFINSIAFEYALLRGLLDIFNEILKGFHLLPISAFDYYIFLDWFQDNFINRWISPIKIFDDITVDF